MVVVPMDDQNKNLLLATVLSFLVILVWFVLFPPEEPVVDPNAPAAIGTYSQAVNVNGTVYLSGQIGLNPATGEMVDGIDAQITQVFENLKAVVYDFCESRAGKHACEFLKDWSGTLLVDDFAGYKQLMGEHIQEAGCWAHARRKFFELHAANQSQIAVQALDHIGLLYDIERRVQGATNDERLQVHMPKSADSSIGSQDERHLWLQPRLEPSARL